MATRMESPETGARAKSGRPYLYIVGANGTAIVDPSNGHVIVTAPRIVPGRDGDLIFDNHYRDPLESKPTLNGYITPDPGGTYLYASVETGLQVIDVSSFRVVETIRIGGVVGTPFLLE